MDDPGIFLNFLTNTCNVTVPRAQNEILGFLPDFRALLNTPESQIDEFVKNTHSSNSARAANARILVPSGAIILLKSLRFELEDRRKCNALPNGAQLAAVNNQDMAIFRQQRSQAIEQESQRRHSSLPDVTVPKFDGKNYDDFIAQFNEIISRTYGDYGAPIDYLLRDVNGLYLSPWPTRAEKLRNCLSLNGPEFMADRKTLFSLFVQYIGTTGHGSNLVTKYKTNQNGYQLYVDFKNHYHNEAYLGNQASAANQSLAKLQYKGERQFFNIETYYSRMTKAFNDLQNAGPAHALNEDQKISKFEIGLKESNAIKYHIEAKIEWDSLPAPKSFDDFYNLFSRRMSQYMTMTSTMTSNDGQRSKISALSGRGGNNSFTGRGRGRGRGRGGRGRGGRGRFNGRGRGRGHHTRQHNPYAMARSYNSFVPEARSYTSEEWRSLTNDQKEAVIKAKMDAGWMNAFTPPVGFILNDQGRPTPSNSLVSAVQSVIGQVTNHTGHEPPIPPPPALPPMINAPVMTSPAQAGLAFGRNGVRRGDSSTISSVTNARITVNGQSVNEAFDRNGNPL